MASSACMSHSPLCTRPMVASVTSFHREAAHRRKVSTETGGRGISNPSATLVGYALDADAAG